MVDGELRGTLIVWRNPAHAEALGFTLAPGPWRRGRQAPA
jgi:hypothetical protein